jgi:hypothetical protein
MTVESFGVFSSAKDCHYVCFYLKEMALYVTTDGTCREILEHHVAVYAFVNEDPAALVACALAHCASLTLSMEAVPTIGSLPLRAHQLDPYFLWAPPAARAAVIAWARDVFIVQFAATTQPFGILPDDCAGDVLEFFGITRKDSDLIAKHCSSPEASAWVQTVVTAAAAIVIVVSTSFFFVK